MADVLTCFQVEWFKLRRRALPRVLLAVMIGFLALGSAAFQLLAYTPATTPALAAMAAVLLQLVAPPNSLYVTLSGINQVGAVLAIILGAAVIGGEQQSGLLRTSLLRQPSRARYLGGLLLALGLALSVGLLLTVMASLLVSLLVALLTGLPVDWVALGATLTGPAYPAALGRSLLTLVIYLLLGVAVTVLSRSVALGMGASLAYHILDSLLVTSTLNLLRTQLEQLPGLGPVIQLGAALLLGYNLTLLNSMTGIELRLTGPGAGAFDPVVLPWHTPLVVGGYLVLLAAAPFLLLRRRDLGTQD
jgi:ABC-type transport system involved in multi-copper enzyme maturation permease subunit